VLHTGPGSLCQSDGWPGELWKTFIAYADRLADGSIGEKLMAFVKSDLGADIPVVAQWRALIQGKKEYARGESPVGRGRVPVPVTLESDSGARVCIISWSARSMKFRSSNEALHSPEAQRLKPNLMSQAMYYLECVLAKSHGVEFGSNDYIEDKPYEQTLVVIGLARSVTELESQRIADPKYGRLDRFG
jgi:hypothetical protein